ncbi:MAG: hypothetical protein M0R28_20255 [Pigmentiphaga sp.]|nr:hypothetical protein [Pigmentiphaga sp.]
MTYYRPTKAEAEAAAKELQADPRVSTAMVQFEPYNGWMVVLVPARYDLSDLADRAEIQDGKRRPAPVAKVRPRPLADMPGQGGRGRPAGEGGQGGGVAPVRGATAKVWQIADGVGKADRNAIIQACVAAGINQSTAATQYSKWKKARGF